MHNARCFFDAVFLPCLGSSPLAVSLGVFEQAAELGSEFLAVSQLVVLDADSRFVVYEPLKRALASERGHGLCITSEVVLGRCSNVRGGALADLTIRGKT